MKKKDVMLLASLPEHYDTEGYDGVGQQGADGHHVHELLKVEDGCHYTCYHINIKLAACTDSLHTYNDIVDTT